MGESGATPPFLQRAVRLGTLLLGLGGLGSALLVSFGCGGRADGSPMGTAGRKAADENDDDEASPTAIPPRGSPTRLGGATGTTTPSEAPGIAPSAVPTFCYAPDDLDREPELQTLMPLLPEAAFDASGCLTSEYSGWLVPGRCVYDPSGAELTDGRCCYRMDGVVPDCP